MCYFGVVGDVSMRIKLYPICEELKDEIFLTAEEDCRISGLWHVHCERGRCSIMFEWSEDNHSVTFNKTVKRAMKIMCYNCEFVRARQNVKGEICQPPPRRL